MNTTYRTYYECNDSPGKRNPEEHENIDDARKAYHQNCEECLRYADATSYLLEIRPMLTWSSKEQVENYIP